MTKSGGGGGEDKFLLVGRYFFGQMGGGELPKVPKHPPAAPSPYSLFSL